VILPARARIRPIPRAIGPAASPNVAVICVRKFRGTRCPGSAPAAFPLCGCGPGAGDWRRGLARRRPSRSGGASRAGRAGRRARPQAGRPAGTATAPRPARPSAGLPRD
jgi:hypothetical protein